MKRFFSVKNKNFLKTTLILFALLSSTVALWAQPQSSTDYNIFAYRLKCTEGDQYMYPMGTTDGSYAGTNNSNNANNYWYFVPSRTNNYYYIRNVATGQYLYVSAFSSGQGNVKVSSSTNESEAQTYLFTYSRQQGQGNENNYYITPLGTDADLDSWGGNQALGLWNDGRNSKWNFYNYNPISISTHNPSSNPISVDGVSGNGIQLVRANTFDISYKSFSFGGTTYYQFDGVQTTTLPNFTSATYSWSLASGDEYATISADGVLASKGVATTMQTVTVKLTATVEGKNYSVTKDIQIQDFSEQLATLSLSGPDVINTVSSSQPVQANWSGSYTPAYTNYKYDYNDHNVFNGQIYSNIPTLYSLTGCTLTWSLSGEGAPYATVEANATAGNVTYNTEAPHDVVVGVMLNVTHTDYPGLNLNAGPHNMTLYSTTINPPVITYNPGEDFVTISSVSEGSTVYTLDGTDPDNYNSVGTAYSAPVTLTSSPTTIKAVTERWGHVSSIAEKTVYLTCATPVITIAEAQVTITAAPSDATIYYTVDGTTPSASATEYEGPFTAMPGATIKAIAIKSGWENSEVATKEYELVTIVTETMVIINDLEDHNWTYYSGVDAAVDDGHYNTAYLHKMYNPDPRNVKITYKGVDLSGNLTNAVSISGVSGEGQNVMVYYKTIEKYQVGEDAPYAYTLIPNPFSKRPKSGSTYYGFAGWKLISGAEYIQRAAGKAAAANGTTVFDLDEPIHFKNLNNNYTKNCISAEIVLEATWTPANVKIQKNMPTDFNTGTYETNFWVISENPDGNFTLGQNMTVTQMTPDGGATGDYRQNFAMARDIDFNHDVGVTPKIEWLNWNNGHAVDPKGKNLFIGRGVTNSASPNVYGVTATNVVVNQIVRIESGQYGEARQFNYNNSDDRNGGSAVNQYAKQIWIWGCDYDRAKNDNSKLSIYGEGMHSNRSKIVSDNRVLTTRTFFKSGEFQKGREPVDGGSNLYYMGRPQDGYKDDLGRRYFEIQGGVFCNIAGASTCHDAVRDTVALYLRIKGGTIRGMIFGCARTSTSNGSRVMVLTGGHLKGWIATGANGTTENGGLMNGTGYLYVGGRARVDSENDDTRMNRSIGGNVFGSGCGWDLSSTAGQVSGGTNVVVADEAFVERGVYGGGSFGYCSTDKMTYMYITGGTVGAKFTSYTGEGTAPNNIPGGVYGGSQMNKGGSVKLYMTGGLVKSGLYGGSNSNGTLEGDVLVKIVGGQIGTSDNRSNVHGGGLGATTRIKGNVDVIIGQQNADEGPVVNGDVYGGSAEGKTNGTDSHNGTKKTTVTLSAGTINGALYGGGLGTASNPADVYGPVQVKVYGGSVKTTDGTGNNGSGGVYGCNNTNGEPKSTVNVDIYHTDPAPSSDEYALHAVYGGGNKADYAQGTPHVTVHRCDNSIEYVYGGGNAADITNGNTDVTIYGGDVIGNVFGGGNGSAPGTEANVSGGTNVKIYGGTILNVFGGSNTSGTIGGNINVLAESRTESGESNCPMDVKSLFAGGNLAACNGGTVTVNCGAKVDDVYGGANMADINNNIHLVINGGNIHRVFGGNNASGTITGTITVDIDVTGGCGDTIGYVYGGGNQAPYTAPSATPNYPEVNVIKGHIIHDVYGGGLGLKTDATKGTITGNPQVKIYQGQTGGKDNVKIGGNVFGGGNAGKVIGNTNVQVGVTE